MLNCVAFNGCFHKTAPISFTAFQGCEEQANYNGGPERNE